jgi:iron(III) transport system permease protein
MAVLSRARVGARWPEPATRALGRTWSRLVGAHWGLWALVSGLIAFALALPVLTVLASLLQPRDAIWEHLVRTVLPVYLANTLALAVGVGLGTLVLGTAAAWLVTMCRFPGRGLFEWALLLPMAMPTYLIAYAYTDLLQFTGPVQSTLRAWTGWGRQDYWFPQIRSLEGAIFVMALVLYPYVYLLARAAFLQQSVCLLEVSRTLGRGPWRTFLTVALPLARPALVAGMALAVMEALADYGAVQYFAVDTLSTGIYRTWFGMNSLPTATQLAACLVLIVFGVLALERLGRGRARYHHTTASVRPLPAYRLEGPKAVLAALACALPFTLGFIVPAGAFVAMTRRGGDPLWGPAFWQLIANTFTLSVIAAALAVVLALVLAYSLRLAPSPVTQLTARLAALGYAVPGAVIAVGVLIVAGWLDNTVLRGVRAWLGVPPGLVVSGTLGALIFAYLVRYLTASFSTVEASLTRISPSLDEAPRTLGHGLLSTLWRVHLPLLRGGLLTAALLVFVDVMKELPATLAIRPFNFDTLAIRVYRLATDERLAEASTAALTIVAVGLIPVIVLSLAIARARPGDGRP